MVRIINGKIKQECEWCHKAGNGFIGIGNSFFCSQSCMEKSERHRINNTIVTKFFNKMKRRIGL